MIYRVFKITHYVLCGLVFVFLVAPIAIIVPMSFSSARFLKFPPPGFSLQWYANYFNSPDWIGATLTSLQVALLTTLLATTLGTLLAVALTRGKFKGRSLLYAFAVSPMIIPLIISAIAIYFFYAKLHLVGTITGLVLAHTLLAIPFVLILVSSTLKGFDATLERASLSLGANPVKTFLLVTLPVIRPGVISAALFAFITSFDELVIAIFISGVHAVTLPKRMWDGIRMEIDPTIAAVSSMLIGVSILLMILVQILKRRQQ